MSAYRRLTINLAALLLPLASSWAGWSFDTAVSPEQARDLFAAPDSPHAPVDSWLRIRGMDARSIASIEERRNALQALRHRGYRLVAMIWPSGASAGGVRPGQPLRRLPLDLREPAARCRQLAETYGDLIDAWEIAGEPDISFVEENPEIYAAYLKACYLGIKAGRSDARPGSEPLPPASSRGAVDVSSVLMAALALPPGPYFNAWMANDGLRYTDGFNYHYYGYAEDFTGVYRQFEAAVTQAVAPTTTDESIFTTQFYPLGTGWQSHVFSRFAAAEGDPSLNREFLQMRPLGTHEPRLVPQGRWMVTPGTTIRETDNGWEFVVTQPGPGPRRPAMVELPLPAGWSIHQNTSLAFEYRATTDDGRQTAEGEAAAANHLIPPPVVADPPLPEPHSPSPTICYPSSLVRPLSSAPVTRALPVFVTEYGYGLLDDKARKTAAGRERQRAWFMSTERQARDLGLTRALAFNFQPDYTLPLGEFGLLMNQESSPADAESDSAAAPRFAGFTRSPALTFLLEAGEQRIEPHDWTVASNPPAPVVIDFVPEQSLVMNKKSCGYFLTAESTSGSVPAPGDISASSRIVLYNFAPEAVTGELSLDGAWMLAGEKPLDFVHLAAGERREIPVVLRLAPTDRYAPQRATARFRRTASALQAERPDTTPQTPVTGSKAASATPPPTKPPLPASAGLVFEAFIRTRNGNLYQTWPRLTARATWQRYVESFANFTPTFYGRAHLPSALTENEPAALVFFFRPTTYPATYQVRRARVVEFVAPPGGKK